MEREFDAYKLSRSMYPSIFPVIRTASAKNRRFHVPKPTFLFPLETPLRLSRNLLHGWKGNSVLAKPLAACTYLFSIVSELYDAYRHFIIPPLHSTPPLGGFPLECRDPLWYGKTRMVSLPDGEKKFPRYVYSLWRYPRTWRTDRQTLRNSKDRAYAWHRAVKTYDYPYHW